MKTRIGTLSTLLVAPALFAGLVPVSRTCTYSGRGYYYSSWNYPYEPIVSYSWDASDSCSVFGPWWPANATSYSGGMFWHASDASVNYVQFIASAQQTGHLGMQFSFEDDQRTSFEYVFDVLHPTRVSIYGFGSAKMTSASGFSLLADSLPSTWQTITLPPSRYTVKDMFVNGHGQAHFQMKLLDCLGDINNDAQVNDADFVWFTQSYIFMLCSDPAMAPGCPADLNYDNIVDDRDFVVFAISYDAMSCP